MNMEERTPKKLRSEIEANYMEFIVGGPSKRQKQAPSSPLSEIFKLNAHCFDEIFEYMTKEDLHSFGKTCKIFNKVAGEYFKRNYSAKRFYIRGYQGVHLSEGSFWCDLAGFNNFVTKVCCVKDSKYLANYTEQLNSINHLECVISALKSIRKILPKLDSLKLSDELGSTKATDSNRPTNLLTNLSEICPNLHLLSIGVKLAYGRHVDDSFKYILPQIYPNLTQFQCHDTSIFPEMDDLNFFFELNPGVRCFSLRFKDICENSDDFLNSKIKLDLLIVTDAKKLTPETVGIFKQLHERGFYKRLHLVLGNMNQDWSDELLTLPLEKLTVYDIYNWPQLPQLKKLDLISPYLYPNRVEILADNSANLERVSVLYGSFEVVLSLVRRSVNLRKIRVSMKNQTETNLKLVRLNKEREKLPGAKKLTIYVEDDVFLETKWSIKNGDTNLSMVQMKRDGMFEWDDY